MATMRKLTAKQRAFHHTEPTRVTLRRAVAGAGKGAIGNLMPRPIKPSRLKERQAEEANPTRLSTMVRQRVRKVGDKIRTVPEKIDVAAGTAVKRIANKPKLGRKIVKGAIAGVATGALVGALRRKLAK